MLLRLIVAVLSLTVASAARPKLPDPAMKKPVRTRDLEPEDDRFMSELRTAGSGWVEIDDGVLMQIVEKGTDPDAEQAALNKDVKCHFKGMFANTTVFDGSHDRGEGAMQVPVAQTLLGWQKCLPLMRVGDVAKCCLEPQWAFGQTGAPPHVPPNTVVCYEIKLEEVIEENKHHYIHPDYADYAEEYQKFLHEYAAKQRANQGTEL
ncbi:hypothetical protein ACA910_000986 [Epithemia clementina (nom. ined.)]